MPWTDDLLSGLAAYLAEGGFATWRPAAPYIPADITPIFITAVPASPDRIITLSPYQVGDDFSMAHDVQGVNVRLRGVRNDTRSVNDLSDSVFDRLHGAYGITLPGGLRLSMCERRSGTPLGVDGNGRHERSENYYLTVHRPSQHRT